MLQADQQVSFQLTPAEMVQARAGSHPEVEDMAIILRTMARTGLAMSVLAERLRVLISRRCPIWLTVITTALLAGQTILTASAGTM